MAEKAMNERLPNGERSFFINNDSEERFESGFNRKVTRKNMVGRCIAWTTGEV